MSRNKMTYIFGENSKYEGKSLEQVALTGYLHIAGLLEYPHSGEDLKKNIRDISEKLNNFIPIRKCSILTVQKMPIIFQ